MFSPRDICDQYGLIDDYLSKYAIPPIATLKLFVRKN